jgi:hypothetical protein
MKYNNKNCQLFSGRHTPNIQQGISNIQVFAIRC